MKQTKEQIKTKLIKLYQEMYELTNPECRKCRAPLSCCSSEYCELAKEMAEEVWNVELIPFNKDAKLPFMSPTGCIVAPHLRPNCTLHHCAINSVGFFPIQPELTEKYFALREQIDMLECDLLELNENANKNESKH